MLAASWAPVYIALTVFTVRVIRKYYAPSSRRIEHGSIG
jgi:hypothetical protein